MFADGHNRRFADDSEGKRGDCRLICGGVPVGYKGIVLCFPYLNSFCIRILFNLEFESWSCLIVAL